MDKFWTNGPHSMILNTKQCVHYLQNIQLFISKFI